MTNGEILRGMTDPELVELLADEPWCHEKVCSGTCNKCIKVWLGEEGTDPLRGIVEVLRILFPNADNKTLRLVAGQIRERIGEDK